MFNFKNQLDLCEVIPKKYLNWSTHFLLLYEFWRLVRGLILILHSFGKCGFIVITLSKCEKKKLSPITHIYVPHYWLFQKWKLIEMEHCTWHSCLFDWSSLRRKKNSNRKTYWLVKKVFHWYITRYNINELTISSFTTLAHELSSAEHNHIWNGLAD